MTYTRITAAPAFLDDINDRIDRDSKIISQSNYDVVYNCKVSKVKIEKIKKRYDVVVEFI